MLLKSVAVEYAADGDPGQQHLSRPRRERDGGFPGGGRNRNVWAFPPKPCSEAIRKTIPLGRMASVDDIVRTALFLASDVSSYLTGQSLNLSGGMITEV